MEVRLKFFQVENLMICHCSINVKFAVILGPILTLSEDRVRISMIDLELSSLLQEQFDSVLIVFGNICVVFVFKPCT